MTFRLRAARALPTVPPILSHTLSLSLSLSVCSILHVPPPLSLSRFAAFLNPHRLKLSFSRSRSLSLFGMQTVCVYVVRYCSVVRFEAVGSVCASAFFTSVRSFLLPSFTPRFTPLFRFSPFSFLLACFLLVSLFVLSYGSYCFATFVCF